MKRIALTLAGPVLLLAACTSIQVKPLQSSNRLSTACVEKNEKVIVDGFEQILRTGFERNGMNVELYAENAPDSCRLVVEYTALQSWDFVTYLSHAEIWLHNQAGKQIAYAKYHLVGGGGLALTKWASTKSKMDPVINRLLAEYDRASQS